MTLTLQIIILIAAVIAGSFLVDLFRKQQNLKLLLSFSGGFLLTIIFTHILPESYEWHGAVTGYMILLGFLLQLVLEYFSKGAEHGHTHGDHSHGHLAFPYAIFISLSLHAFIESMPLHDHDHGHMEDFYWGIILHKIPVAVALKVILNTSGLSGIKSWIFILFFALMAPAGLLIGDMLNESGIISTTLILAVAVGMLLHISTTIIFESSEGHRINLIKFTAILIGFGAGLLLNLI